MFLQPTLITLTNKNIKRCPSPVVTQTRAFEPSEIWVTKTSSDIDPSAKKLANHKEGETKSDSRRINRNLTNHFVMGHKAMEKHLAKILVAPFPCQNCQEFHKW